MGAKFLHADELRAAARKSGFRVKPLARFMGMNVRTLERRFEEQWLTSPKAWIIHERMVTAVRLLADGLSNKEVANGLGYTCQSNFCRDFKRHFGCAPQEFVRHGGARGVMVKVNVRETSALDEDKSYWTKVELDRPA